MGKGQQGKKNRRGKEEKRRGEMEERKERKKGEKKGEGQTWMASKVSTAISFSLWYSNSRLIAF